MKVHALAAIALSATILTDHVDSFTPNNLSPMGPTRPSSRSRLQMNIPTASAGDIAFPYDDDEVRSAYDEWRFTYNKGVFDAQRFEQFKSNYVALTVENLRARQDSVTNGTPAPEWRKLNEFGDYSMEEFSAYKNQGTQPAYTAPAQPEPVNPTELFPMYNPADNSRRTMPVVGSDISAGSPRSTMPVPQDSSRRTIAIKDDTAVPINRSADPIFETNQVPAETENDAEVRASYDDCRSAYLSWCDEYGKEADAVKFATFSSNYLAMKEYADKSGRPLNLNAYADCTKEEYELILNGQSGNAQVSEDASAVRSTLQVEDAASDGRPTQIIPGSDQGPSMGAPRPTLVVQKGQGPSPQGGFPPRATQVVQSGDVAPQGGFSPRATQVVQRADPNASSGAGVAPRPTHVLQSGSDFGGRPTIVMPPTAIAPSATQVIQQSTDPATSGTQVIQSASDASDRAVRGTVVIQNNNQSKEPSGFQQMSNMIGSLWDDKKDDDDDDDENSPRGDLLGRSTIVIKRQIVEKEPVNPFATYEPPKADLPPVATEAGATQVIGNVDESSMMSLFGGEGKSSENPRPVRGTIRIDQPSQRQPVDGPRKTILIDKQKDGNPETIFSFFGGAKKPDDPNDGGSDGRRPTITINKKEDDATTTNFPFSNYGFA